MWILLRKLSDGLTVNSKREPLTQAVRDSLADDASSASAWCELHGGTCLSEFLSLANDGEQLGK